jgi:hypothetical protein
MGDLALTTMEQGRVAEAEALLQQLLEIGKRVRGLEHAEILRSMHYLALALHSLGKEDDALALMLRCCELLRRSVGEDHPITKSSLKTINRWQSSNFSSV